MHLNGGTGYHISRVVIKKPISTMSLTRNEVTQVIKRKYNPICVNITRTKGIPSSQWCRTQRNSVILRDLEYIVEFNIDYTDGEFQRTDGHKEINTRVKYENQLLKRLENNSCYHQPYFGCKEFSIYYEPSSFEEFSQTNENVVPYLKIENMLYEVLNLENISEISPTFTTIEVKNSIITYPSWKQIKNQ